jgi:5-formyltetrahydrofolate cyclo-ligase family.
MNMNKIEVNKKQELRKQILQRRTKLNSSYQKIANEKIIQNIIDSYEYQRVPQFLLLLVRKEKLILEN